MGSGNRETWSQRSDGCIGWFDAAVCNHHQMCLNAEDRHRFMQAVRDSDTNPKQQFKDDKRSRVIVFEWEQRDWVVKWIRMSPLKTFAYHLVRRTPAWREWQGSHRLAALGCRVNSPIALIHDASLGRWSQRLVLPHIEGDSLHHYIRDDVDRAAWTQADHDRRSRIARSVGRQIGELAASGTINRDHKPSNLIVDSVCETSDTPPWMIDPAGIRVRRSDDQVLQMLDVMWRAARRAGFVSHREMIDCIRAVLEADVGLFSGSGNRVHECIQRLRGMMAVRPLSYDPGEE